MIGGFVGRILDSSEARREAENLLCNYNQLLQEHAAAKGTIKALNAENRQLRQKARDLEDALDGETERLVASLTFERDRKDKAVAQAVALQAERDIALAGRRVAERALDAARIPVVARREEQDRANAYKLAAVNDELRRLAEDLEHRVAELEAQLRARVEKEHP